MNQSVPDVRHPNIVLSSKFIEKLAKSTLLRRPYQCSLCQAALICWDVINEHLASQHCRRRKTRDDGKRQKYSCGFPGCVSQHSTLHDDALRDHIGGAHMKGCNVACPFFGCSKEVSLVGLRGHVNSHHKNRLDSVVSAESLPTLLNRNWQPLKPGSVSSMKLLPEQLSPGTAHVGPVSLKFKGKIRYRHDATPSQTPSKARLKTHQLSQSGRQLEETDLDITSDPSPFCSLPSIVKPGQKQPLFHHRVRYTLQDVRKMEEHCIVQRRPFQQDVARPQCLRPVPSGTEPVVKATILFEAFAAKNTPKDQG